MNDVPPPTHSDAPIGLLGAYERDNFGDILFLERTRTTLGDTPSIALTSFRHTPELLTHAPPITIADAHTSTPLRGLWAVGGEVGAVAVYSAYRMLDAVTQGKRYQGGSRGERRRIIREASGSKLTDLAYLPRPSAYPAFSGMPSVVNSVGLTGVGLLRGDMRIAAMSALREADFVSVRDRESSALLTAANIAHRVSPDLVHTLRLDHPDLASSDSRQAARAEGRVALQVSEAQLQTIGVDRLAHSIATATSLKGKHVRLFVAGTAPHHDSLVMYEQLARAIRGTNPGLKVTISEAVDPLTKVRELASSSLVLATSLHAMIISMSFNVPHAGLFIAKVTRYARSWGDPMPTNVALSGLNDAAELALSSGRALEDSSVADDLAVAARANALEAKRVFSEDSADKQDARREKRRASASEVRHAMRDPRILSTRIARSLLRPLS